MASVSENIITYEDLLSYITSLLDGGARTKDLRMHKEVIQGAYRDIAMGNEWAYYITEGRINLDASSSSSTVTSSDGTTLVLASGNWPSWAKYGRVVIGDNVYNVKSASGSTLTFGDLKPTGAIASGTKYTIYRTIYPLPEDLWSIRDVGVMQGNWVTYYISPVEWQQREAFLGSSGQPWAWTLMKDPHEMNRWAMWVEPSPTTAEPLMFVYRRKPRTLRWAGTETTARTCTASGSDAASALTSIANSSGAVNPPSSMVGSILRLVADGSLATGLAGNNPYNEQHEITTVGTATLSIAGTLSQAYSGAKILISDPVDMSDNMIEALKAQIEYRLARFANDKRGTVTARKVADFELRRALEAESRVSDAGGVGRYSRYDYLFTHLSNTITTISGYV